MAETLSARYPGLRPGYKARFLRDTLAIGGRFMTLYSPSMARRSSSAFGDLIALLFLPVTWLLRLFIGRKRASPGLVKWFYKTPEWKRLRYAHLAKSPSCLLCGRSAKDGARMNVDHIKPLSYHWNLRLAPHNLQTLCANCNHGKGGKTADHRHR